MAKAVKRQIECLRSSNFLRTWHVRRGEVCDIEGVALSMNRPAPRLQHGAARDMPAKSEKPVANTKRKSDDPYLNLLDAAFDAADAVARFLKWLKSPPAPPPPPPIVSSVTSKVPPFDLQGVPKAMPKLGLPMAAKLQERWFAGSANCWTTVSGGKDMAEEVISSSTRTGSMCSRTHPSVWCFDGFSICQRS